MKRMRRMQIRDWLELAIAIENRSAELYRKFAGLFKHHSEIADYWVKMELDENRHRSILQQVMHEIDESDAKKTIDERKAENSSKLLSCIHDDLSKVFSNLDDAYECAHELEEKEVEVIFDLLKEESMNKYEGIHTLLKEDQEHLQKLIDFGDTFGKMEWRKLINSSKQE